MIRSIVVTRGISLKNFVAIKKRNDICLYKARS